MGALKQQSIREEEAQLPLDIQAQSCDCLHCTSTIWNRSSGYRDFITPSDRAVVTPWPKGAKLFWAGYAGLIAAGIIATAKAFGWL